MLFDTPQVIANRRDLNRVISKLRSLNVRDYVNARRRNSLFKPNFITNVKYYIYKTAYPLGSVHTVLPKEIIQNK